MPPPERLRVAFVLDTLDGSAGGVVSAQRVVAALRERHDVTVVAAGEPGAAGSGRVVLPPFYVPFVRRIMESNGYVFAWPKRRPLEDALRAADVVHVQFPFWLGLRAVAIARALGKPLVVAHHVQPENVLYNLRLTSPRAVEGLYRFLLRRFFDPADAVVCPSPFALEALASRGLRVPAEVISNGVPRGAGPGSADAPGAPFTILVAGRLAREKRVDVAIEGVRRSRFADRIQLVITGRGPEEDRVRALAAGLPVPARIGFVPEAELRRLQRTATLQIHASEVELEGMAVLEALASGTPSLLARAEASAARQFAISDDFLFAPGDPADLAARLDALLADPARLAGARAACLARAEAYGFEAAIDRLDAIYRRVFALRSAPAA